MSDKDAPLRGAVIGCGFFATNQLEAWRDLPGVEIVALCDRDRARLDAAGERFGIAARYADAERMLSEQTLDFVDIATTAPSHRALAELAASRGVATICQKPIAPTLADASAMVAAAEAGAVPLMVHENFRWQTPILAVKRVLDDGAIGTPFWGRVSFRSGHDVYAAQPYLAHGERFIIEDLGIHLLDLARFLFGDAHAISARTRRVNPKIRGEDVATMLLDHAGGITSVVDCSYASRQERDPFPETLVEIDGTLGMLRLDRNYRLRIDRRDGATEQDVSPPLLPWARKPWHNIQDSVFNIQRHWVERLRDRLPPDTSGRDNLRTFALVQAAYRSAETGDTVRLDAL